MKHINIRIVCYFSLLLIGVTLLIFASRGVLSDFYEGFGIALLILSTARVIQAIMYKSHKEYAKKMDIAYTDERNIYITHKARSYTFLYGILAVALLTIIFRFFGENELSTIMGFVVFGFVTLYWIIYFIVKNKN